MESLKCLIKKLNTIDGEQLIKYYVHSNDIIYKLFNKSIVDIEFTTATKYNMQVILYIATIIFKKNTVVYDFKQYTHPHIFTGQKRYLECSLYTNRFEQLVKNNQNIIDTNQSIQDIDVVISSGGQAGFFVLGICDIMNNMKYCNIHRISGVSVGAWAALFYIAKLDNIVMIDLYLQISAHYSSEQGTNMRISEYYYEAWGSYLKNLIDVDFYKTCNNRLFIGYTELTPTGAKFNVKSNYSSNEDVIMTCIASSAIPFMTIDGLCVIMDGKKILDGGLLNNEYFFEDNKREQLYIDVMKVVYDPNHLLSPTDKNIDKLFYRGAEEMVSFLETGQSKIISLIKN